MPAWVQAVGSVVGIVVAVAVASHAQRQALFMRALQVAEQDYAHAVRLHMLIWEALQATDQLFKRAQTNIFRREFIATMESSVPEEQRSDELEKEPVLMDQDVRFFERIMQRAMTNLDDDLNAHRHIIAGKFRFNLSALISSLEVRVGQISTEDHCDRLQGALIGFKSDLHKLSEYCPRLSELDDWAA